MSDNQQTEKLTNGRNIPDDEIDLIHLFRILWKWKYLIAGGTALFAIAAAIISIIMPKVYSIDTVIEPGILSIVDAGEGEGQEYRIYIDSTENVKALIDIGTFDQHLLAYLGQLSTNGDLPEKIEFTTDIPKNSKALKVSYESSNVEQGKQILSHLNNLLLKKYSNLITYYQRNLYNQIKNEETKRSKISKNILKTMNEISTRQSKTNSSVKQKTNKIAARKAGIEAKKMQIGNLKARIKDIQLEIIRITKNTDFLIEERNKLLATEKKENDILSSVIYINTIQQNIVHSNNLKSEISNVTNKIVQVQAEIKNLEIEISDLAVQKESLIEQTKYQIATLQSQIKDLENQRKYAEEKIKNLEFKKGNVQNLQIIKPPTNNSEPVRPRLLANLILAFMIGLFLMSFLSFFLEYNSKNRQIR